MYIGIDLGTTGLKCVMFDETGAETAVYNEEYPLIFIDSYVEQDSNLWWENCVSAIRGLVEKTGIRDIDAISISTQSISIVPVDKAGNTLYNSINWLDMRAVEECERIEAAFGKEKIFEKTGKPCDPAYSLPKMIWLKENAPDVWRAADKVLFPLDYLNMKLCGRAICDYSVAGGSMLYNIKDKCWDEELLEFSGIEKDKLPEVGVMGEYIGKILPESAEALGINPECKIVLGGQDQKLAAIGAGISESVCTMSFGTASAIEKIHREPAADTVVPQFRFDDGYFVSEAVAEMSGAALKWLSRMMGDISYREMDILASQSAPGANGVKMVTSFSTGASVEGMTLSTSKGDIIYALYEGVCTEIKQRLDEIGGASELRVFGGGSKSRIWCEILARITGCRICILDTPETASRGAAILASGRKIAPAQVALVIEP